MSTDQSSLVPAPLAPPLAADVEHLAERFGAIREVRSTQAIAQAVKIENQRERELTALEEASTMSLIVAEGADLLTLAPVPGCPESFYLDAEKKYAIAQGQIMRCRHRSRCPAGLLSFSRLLFQGGLIGLVGSGVFIGLSPFIFYTYFPAPPTPPIVKEFCLISAVMIAISLIGPILAALPAHPPELKAMHPRDRDWSAGSKALVKAHEHLGTIVPPSKRA